MPEDMMAEVVERGRATLDAIALVRRHCRHARVELPSGNSPVGAACGLPLGELEVRCEHAPPPRTSGFVALDLAVEFYRANCVGCPHRDGTGELPNLVTVVAARDADDEHRRQEAQCRATERAARHVRRRERRRRSVAGEGYLVRDLADVLDRLDADRFRDRPPTDAETAAARELIESARHAPELFGWPLVESLLEMAIDTAEPAVLVAIRELVRAGRCSPRAAVETALAVLRDHRLPEAGSVLAAFTEHLRPDDLPPALDRLVELAAGQDRITTKVPPDPGGLLAAACVDLPQVTEHLLDRLVSDNDRIRADGAAGAQALLEADATRVVALGPALVTSIRGADRGYAGEPHPAGTAARALAEAWRREPATTVAIIECTAADVPVEARAELVRVVWFLKRWREPLDVSTEAADAAISFCLRRLSGDWGEKAGHRAADELDNLGQDVPGLVLPHVATLLGILLTLCVDPESEPSPLLSSPATDVAAMMAGLEREAARVSLRARRLKIARTVGRLAAHSPAAVLDPVLALFNATSGNENQDRRVRVALLNSLKEAANVELLRDLLPVVYSALLCTDQVVRATAIDLWVRCVWVAGDAIPEDLADLAEALLSDQYVIVHKTMLDRLPQLALPARLANRLLPIVYVWVLTYRDRDEPEVLADALWALRHLAGLLDDGQQTVRWDGFVLAQVPRLLPSDRQRMLTSCWAGELRSHPAWSRAALGALADPELTDIVSPRHDPLLAALLDHPQPLSEISLEEISAVSEIHLPDQPWRALEPVELLQAVERHADAGTLANRVEARMPQGAEGAPGRELAELIVAATGLDDLLRDVAEIDTTTTDNTVRAVQESVAAFSARRELGAECGDSPARQLIEIITARATAVGALLAPITTDPQATADMLERAAQQVEAAAGHQHASAAQRRRVAAAWRIAATLARWDAAVRAADADSSRLLPAAQRQAQVLAVQLDTEPSVPVPDALFQFCAAVAYLASTGDMSSVFTVLARVALPVRLVHLSDGPPHHRAVDIEAVEEPPLAVCVASFRGAPITDVFVARPHEVYSIEMTVRLPAWPEWAQQCHVEQVTRLGRDALTLPKFVFGAADAVVDEGGVLLTGEEHLHCAVEQPIHSPAFDCPLVVRFGGDNREQRVEVAGYRRLRLRPFDPSRDPLTEHEQTDARLLTMYDALTDPAFDTEDVRACCRLFTACVTAGQSIMFDKVFRRGARVSEQQFHDELERRLRADPELGGRLTRRDAVAGGFDDLLHDDVIAELKIARNKALKVEDCAKYLGQPTQYGVGRGSQLSVLVVLDHSAKQAPPGVIDNYVGWLKPALHGLDDPRYPSLVGVLIINTNLPVPSTWSRKAIQTVRSPAQTTDERPSAKDRGRIEALGARE